MKVMTAMMMMDHMMILKLKKIKDIKTKFLMDPEQITKGTGVKTR